MLSTTGLETNKFNKLISNKLSQTKNINLSLNTIKFKINPTKFSLFLETQNPKIAYRDTYIPVQNIKVYVDFLSLLSTDPKIERINLNLEELDIVQLNKLSKMIKPSNFKSLLTNKIKKGKLISEIEIFLSEKGELENFIAKGNIKSLETELFSDLSFTNTTLSFFADKNDILIKNILGDLNDIKISDGDIKINFENGVKIRSNFKSKIDLDKELLNNYIKFLNNNKFTKAIGELNGDFNNTFSINLDKTYKVENYNYNITGNIKNSKFELQHSFKNNFIKNEIKDINFSNFNLAMNFSPRLSN